MNQFGVVIPVHNEEDNLKLSLPALERIQPSEVLFILDRCTDDSEKTILNWISNVPYEIKWRIKKIDADIINDWAFRVAGLRRLGYREVRSNIILSMDADMVLDPNMGDIIKNHDFNREPLIRFGFIDYPYNLKSFLRTLFARITPSKPYSGLNAFHLSKWIEAESIESAMKVVKGEDAHLILSFEDKGYKTRYVPTRTLHLRTAETLFQDWYRGKNYAQQVKAPLWKVFAISLLMLRPLMLKSYLYYRGYWIKNRT